MVCVGVGSTLAVGVPLATAAAAALFVQAASQAVEAANQAADALIGQVADWGDELARHADERAEAQLTNRRWHMAAAEAVGLNAAIRMTAARARQLGAAAELPPPVELDGRSLAEVGAWLDRVRPIVRKARTDLDRHVADAEWQRLVAALPPASAATPSVADALRRYQRLLVARHTQEAPPPDLSWVDAEIRAVLAKLDQDADTAGRESALRAAARVAQQKAEIDADAYLSALRRVVEKDVNPRAAARRLAAQWLEGLERPVVKRAISVETRHPMGGVVGALRGVVEGTAELTPDLREQGRAAARWAADVATRAYRLELLGEQLAKLGYGVEQRTDTLLEVSRPAWAGEHGAVVWLGDDGGAHFRLDVLAAAQGDEAAATAAATAAARHADLADSMRAVLHEMTHVAEHSLVARAHEIQHHHDPATVRQTETAARPVPMRHRTAGH